MEALRIYNAWQMTLENQGVEDERTAEGVDLSEKIIIFIGPEGSGKSSMARRLAEESGRPYVSVGDILRDLEKNDLGPWGDLCREMFEKHVYLDPEKLLEILEEKFRERDDLEDGFILDGGLRTLEEVLGFTAMLERAGRRWPIIVVALEVSGEVGVQRILDKDNAKKRGKRKDDYREAILSRQSRYYDGLTERMVAIKENFELFEIDAIEGERETFEKVYHALGLVH